MKPTKTDWIYHSLFFCAGALICYASLQFYLFDLDFEINIWESLLTLSSIGVGLFIAISLQRKMNKNQNLYNYLVNRLDIMWSDFTSFNEVIEASDKIEFTRVTKVIRDLQRRNLEFTKLLVQLDSIPNHFEVLSEQLFHKFEVSIQASGVVYYDGTKTEILTLNESIINNYIAIYKAINERA